MNATTLKPGDRVRINAPREPNMTGMVGVVSEVLRGAVHVSIPGFPDIAFRPHELSLLAEAPSATTIRPGDRVRINAPWLDAHSTSGIVLLVDADTVTTTNSRHQVGTWDIEQVHRAPRMSLPARTLLAAWHASDRTLHKLSDHVCGLDRIRRYGVTATDGLAVDLTLTTEVQL